MSISKDDILQAISDMSVMDVVELVEAMEEKFGVSAAAAAVAVAGPVGGEDGAASDEKTEFDVILTGAGANKVAAIKAVRGITGLGLKEAKVAVESVPTVLKGGISKDEAEDLVKQIKEAGAEAEVK